MNLDLLVIGDCSIDQYMEPDLDLVHPDIIEKDKKTEICFYHGSKVPIKSFHATIAGNACHVGIGAQRLGLQTAIYTELGDDSNGERFITEFKREGVITKLCKKNKGTATNVHAIIWYNKERTIFSYHEKRKYGLDFKKLERSGGKPKWVFYTSLAQGFEKFQGKLVDYLNNNMDIGVACNFGTLQMLSGVENLKSMLARTNVLFANKEEALKLLGCDDEKEMEARCKDYLHMIYGMHHDLQKLGPQITVITDGSKGSSSYAHGEFIELPAPVVTNVVDKTGAGDAYAGAFLAALHYKKSLREAMEWGNKNSASTLAYVGAVKGLLRKSDIEKV